MLFERGELTPDKHKDMRVFKGFRILSLLLGASLSFVNAQAKAQPLRQASTSAKATVDRQERPNIVLILSDDQAWTDYGFMGHPDIQTPHLDKLADSGLRFDRGYVAAPLCRPSLASMVTGQFPVTHGVTGNDVNDGSKRSPYENGTRTPILVAWPGTISPKNMSGFAHSIDLFPTIAAVAGLEAPEGLPGINLLDVEAVNDRTCIFGSMHASHNISIGDLDATLQYLWCIEGDWKLLLRYHGADTTRYRDVHEWDTAPYHLFNLKEDPGETKDLAASHPELVARLKAKIEA